MRKLIILIGAPASGKSTLAHTLQSISTDEDMLPQDCLPILSLDAFRHMMCPTHMDVNSEKVLIAGANAQNYINAYKSSIEAFMRVGQALILDNTHCRWRDIRDAWDLAKQYRYEVLFVKFHANKETLIERDSHRIGSEKVGSEAISAMCKLLDILQLPEGARVIDIAAKTSNINIIAQSIKDNFLCNNINVTSDAETYIFVGDVHSCADRLQKLSDHLSAHKEKIHLVFVGDVFDRGPDVETTIHLLQDFKKKYTCTFIEGNHDTHLSQIFANNKSALDQFGESRETYFAIKDNPELRKFAYMLMKSTIPCATINIGTSTYVITHAGIAKKTAYQLATSNTSPVWLSASDCIYGCGRRNELYHQRHPSDYALDAIEAADGILGVQPVVQVHGHRPHSGNLGYMHYDLDNYVWTDDGCLKTLWVDARTGTSTIYQY